LNTNEIVERNYWGDYMMRYPNATEIESSGVGNTPYSLDIYANGEVIGTLQDNHPLMNPVMVPNFPAISPNLVTSSGPTQTLIPTASLIPTISAPPTLAPTESPKQTPKLEPSPTPVDGPYTDESDYGWIPYAAATAIVISAVLFYLVKRIKKGR
jgi:hypothetical protein